MVSPARLAVALVERFIPPDSKASLVSSGRRTSSGALKAQAWPGLTDKKRKPIAMAKPRHAGPTPTPPPHPTERGRGAVREPPQNKGAARRHDAHVAIDQHVETENVEAKPPRCIGIAAHGVDLPPDIGAVEQKPGDKKADGKPEYLQVDAVGRILSPFELEPEYSCREPIGQRIDVFAAGEENQQPIEDI